MSTHALVLGRGNGERPSRLPVNLMRSVHNDLVYLFQRSQHQEMKPRDGVIGAVGVLLVVLQGKTKTTHQLSQKPGCNPLF